MSEVLLPPWIVPEVETHEWLDEGSSVFRAAFAPGIAQRQSYGGLRLKLSRRHTVRGEEKAQLLSVLKQTRGAYNVLRTKVHFALRGSHSTTELLTNNTFANGTTGWSSNHSDTSISVSDRMLRLTRAANTDVPTILNSAPSAAVQYAPYVARAFAYQGRGQIRWDLRIRDLSDSSAVYATTVSNQLSPGMLTCAGVVLDTDPTIGIIDRNTGKIAGDYMDVSYASVVRCATVDNGLNSLLQSDEFDTTWTQTRVTVDDQTAATTAPDGTSTADAIIDDSTAGATHFVLQNVAVSASVADFSFACALKAGTRTRAALYIEEDTGGTNITAGFNLSAGTASVIATGVNWADVRLFISPLGNGWYYCCVVASKTNAATTIRTLVLGADNATGGIVYNGDGSSRFYAWRATLVQSGVPTRLVQTTTTASTGTSPTGTAMHVKGLPASTNGLLLPGDWIEIGGELKQCTATLNSDAAGLGYLQFEPALVRSPANDDPVIVTDPMGKFLVSNIKIENEFGTQARVSYDLEHIYE